NNDLRVTFNIYTMTFEQLNHLWGALGGKQLPSALYRVYLVQLKDEQVREGGRLIEQIEGQENIF
ncbi:MAG: Pvc16 family protein, partial [Bacteroidota bacterium]